MIWLFIAIITLQFTDVMSLGTSWNRYCKKNKIQIGGEGEAPAPEPPKNTTPEPPKNTTAEPPKNKEGGDEEGGDNKKKKGEGGDEEGGDNKKKKGEGDGDEEGGDNKKKKGEGEGDGEDSVKSIDKKLGLFNKLKGKVKSSAGKFGMAGPVLGNLDGIFSAVEGIFTLLTVILIFIGIISLPALIFLIITYCIIKMIVGKLVIY